MPHCAAINCANGPASRVKVHRFPKDPVRRRQWIQNCRRDKWSPTENSVLCDVSRDEVTSCKCFIYNISILSTELKPTPSVQLQYCAAA